MYGIIYLCCPFIGYFLAIMCTVLFGEFIYENKNIAEETLFFVVLSFLYVFVRQIMGKFK